MSIFGIATTFAQNVTMLIIFRFGVGIGVGGLVIPFDLLAEFTGKADRGKILICIEMFWTLGTMLVSGLAWLTLSSLGWRFLVGMCAVPVTLAAVTVRWLPESPRWLFVKGRDKDAIEVLEYAARVNSKSFPSIDSFSDHHARTENTNIWDLFRPDLRWTTTLLWIIWTSFGKPVLFKIIIK